jgi:hypothetical protein
VAKGWPDRQKNNDVPHELDIPISSDIHEMDLFEKKEVPQKIISFFLTMFP